MCGWDECEVGSVDGRAIFIDGLSMAEKRRSTRQAVSMETGGREEKSRKAKQLYNHGEAKLLQDMVYHIHQEL